MRRTAAIIALVVMIRPELARSGGRSEYLLHCAGCHGLDGVSVVAIRPNIVDCVGRLVKTEDGLVHLLRLPGIRGALIRDNERIAALLNYITQGLGVATESAPIMTPDWIAAARAQAEQSGSARPDRRCR